VTNGTKQRVYRLPEPVDRNAASNDGYDLWMEKFERYVGLPGPIAERTSFEGFRDDREIQLEMHWLR
jgi:hypothetical protein